MKTSQLTGKQLNQLQAWDRFCNDENGAIPATIAALKMKISVAAVYQASERGWIKFFCIGRNRWYGNRSCYLYKEKKITGKNWSELRASQPRDCTEFGFDSETNSVFSK